MNNSQISNTSKEKTEEPKVAIKKEATTEKEETKVTFDKEDTSKEEEKIHSTSKNESSSKEREEIHSTSRKESSSHKRSSTSSSSSSRSSSGRSSSSSSSSRSSGGSSSRSSGSSSSGRSSSRSSSSSSSESRSSHNSNSNSVTDDSAGTERHIRKRYAFSVQSENNIPKAVYRKQKEHKKEEQTTSKYSKRFKIFVGVGASVISFLLVIIITFTTLLVTGKNALIGGNNNVTISPPAGATVDGEYIVYNGKKYQYNNKVTSILLSGIDMHTEEHQEGVLGTAGQADSIFVMALNTETGKYKIISVSRDTMVDVNICDEKGNFTAYKEMQLCLAHAYGGGGELSNENLKRSVSRIFYGIPMNSYMSIDLDAIPVLNDAVGGVPVTVIEDLAQYDSHLTKGATVTLNGKQAEIYVRSRDIEGDADQNNLRMERQQSYIESFIKQAIFQTKHNVRTPLNLYSEASPYAVTDIDASQVTYLASIFMEQGFAVNTNYVKVPGEAVAGEEFAEYYIDDDAFFKIILDTYFKKVK